jgi:hypothetical protein
MRQTAHGLLEFQPPQPRGPVGKAGRYVKGERRAMGAQQTVNAATDAGWTARYAADGLTRKGSFDVLFECSGSAQALRAGLDVMAPRGVVVQLGLGGELRARTRITVRTAGSPGPRGTTVSSARCAARRAALTRGRARRRQSCV